MGLNLDQPLAWQSATNSEQAVLNNLQANILKSHGRDFCSLYFIRFNPNSQSAAKAFVGALVPNFTTALAQLLDTETFKQTGLSGLTVISFLLSASGYDFFSLPKPGDPAFQAGMKQRPQLNDPSVDTWEVPYQQEIHACLLVADDNQTAIAQQRQLFVKDLSTCGTLVAEENGHVLTNAAGETIEHFGFVDGRSQPLMLQEDVNKEGTVVWNSAFPLKQALVQEPGDTTFENLGSYLVIRKLEQNVKAFKVAQQSLAINVGISNELAGAYIVGRFADGTPVLLEHTPSGVTPPANDFNYSTDTNGSKCPFHSHIRKTNPRGDTTRNFAVKEDSERAHLLVRRAISYGGAITDASNPPSAGVGLLFMAFNSSFVNQFEFVQQSWANSANFLNNNTGLDGVIGEGSNTRDGQQWPNTWGDSTQGTTGFDFSNFVTLKGGESSSPQVSKC